MLKDKDAARFGSISNDAPASEEFINDVFLLLQRRIPSKALRLEKVGQPSRDVVVRALCSKFVGEQVLSTFLKGSGCEDDETAVLVSSAALAAVSSASLPHGAKAATHRAYPSDLSNGVPWRLAFHDYVESLGPTAKNLLADLATKSEESAENVRAFNRAREWLRIVDDLVSRQQLGSAYLASRHAVESGFPSVTSRYLILTALLCTDPADLERALDAHGPACGKSLVTALRDLTRTMVEAEDTAFDFAAISESHAPPVYQSLVHSHPPFSPQATTLWQALRRVRRWRHAAGRPSAVPVVVMSAVGASDADIASVSTGLGASGAKVFLVDPDRSADRSSPSHLFVFVESFERAARSIDEMLRQGPLGPVILCNDFAPVPPELLQTLPLVLDVEDIAPLTVDRRSSWGFALDGLSGCDSAFAGVCSRTGETALHLLRAAKERPEKVGEELAASGRLPLALYAGKADEAPIEELHHASLIMRLSPCDSPEAAVTGGRGVMTARLDLTGAEAADLLASQARESQLGADTAFLLMPTSVSYEDEYASSILRQFTLNGGAPVAVKGVRLRSRDSRIVLVENSAGHGGLYQVALMCCACLTLGEAIAALRAWGSRAAAQCIVFCDLPAVAWDAGAPLVHGGWSQITHDSDTMSEVSQRVFEFQMSSLSDKLLFLNRNAVHARPQPYQAYLKRLEAALGRLADETPEAEAKATFIELLDSGMMTTLLNDGRGPEVAHYLERMFNGVFEPWELKREHTAALLDLVLECGLQKHLVGRISALWFGSASDSRSFGQMMSFIVTAGENDLIKATMFSALERALELPDGRHKQRLISAMARFASEFLGGEALEFMVRRLLVNLRGHLQDHPEVLRLLGRLRLGDPILASLGTDVDQLASLASVGERIAAALASGDRARTVSLLRSMTEREGQTRGAIALLRTLSAEVAALGITASEWSYPVFGGAKETLALAAILGDVATIEAHRDSGAPIAVRAAALKAAGDAAALNALYADWAASEGLAAPTFEGVTHYALFDHLNEFGQAIHEERPPMTGSDLPRVSLVVTVYEPDLRLFRSALRSLQLQTWPNLEILVVDDGSATESAQAAERICAEFDRTRFIVCAQNRGPYVSRNVALRHATGDFVAIQDADDVSHPQRLERQLALLRRDVRVQATASRHMRFDSNGRPQFQADLSLAADGTMTTMFRRSIFDRLGPFAATRSRGDVEYRERIRQAFGPAAFVETSCPLTFCYGAPSTLSNSVTREKSASLKAFRHGFGVRRWVAAPDGPKPLGELSVPAALRP